MQSPSRAIKPTKIAPAGLELKICVNTYKIFFVDGTEDYFFRARPRAGTAQAAAAAATTEAPLRPYRPRRTLAAMLGDEGRGWALGLAPEQRAAAARRIERLFGTHTAPSPTLAPATLAGSRSPSRPSSPARAGPPEPRLYMVPREGGAFRLFLRGRPASPTSASGAGRPASPRP